MKAFLIPCLLVASIVTGLIAISCNKTSSGKPTLSLESVNTTVQNGDSMRVRFKFTDGPAISNDNLSWIRHRINDTACATSASGSDTTGYQLPAFLPKRERFTFPCPGRGA